MSRRRRRSGKPSDDAHKVKDASTVEAFWGSATEEPEAPDRIRPTPDPGALPRSLGDPPLTPDTAAAQHVAVVYEEAVRAATALAAANGLLDVEDLPSD